MGRKNWVSPKTGPDPASRGCMYLGRLHSCEAVPSICNYMEIVGHHRDCAPGADCTVKKLVNGRSRRKADK